jgi:hypothetical protein
LQQGNALKQPREVLLQWLPQVVGYVHHQVYAEVVYTETLEEGY